MAKVGGLTKLKSAMKRLPSFTNKRHHSAAVSAAAADSASREGDGQLRTVYVGKTRRMYLLSSDVVGHPLFRELVERSMRFDREFDGGRDGVLVVACEVVLFEHLLWMLKNGPCGVGDDDELVEFYTP